MAGRRWGGVVVVGGANLDTLARSDARVLPGTSNPGTVRRAPGGVGRNVAENLARLGTPVHLVAAVGDDDAGHRVVVETEAAGVGTAHVRRVPGPTGCYAAVVDHDGELVAAVADMRAAEALTPDDVDAAADLLAGAALVVVDGNLAAATAARAVDLAVAAGVPVVLEPVSVPKAQALAPLLDRVRTVTPTLAELAALAGPAGGGTADGVEPDPAALAAVLHARGVAEVWVRRGAAGSWLSGPDGLSEHEAPAPPGGVVDTTGAGDALLAAWCHARLRGEDPAAAAAYAHAAAALTVAGAGPVRPDLTDALVRSLL